ncbi:hypothetical protein LINPERHAP1_LOCUS40989 [Linum perenne]
MNQHKQQCESSLPPKGDVDVNLLKADPGLRKKISSFHPNVQDEVRRVYIQRGPCQPKGHSFPFREIGGKKRRFIASWFDDYWWLEYSIEKDAAYCLPCYLFKHEESKKGAGDSFVSEGFTCWNKKNRLDVHVGGPSSAHNSALRKYEDLMKQSQSIQVALCDCLISFIEKDVLDTLSNECILEYFQNMKTRRGSL